MGLQLAAPPQRVDQNDRMQEYPHYKTNSVEQKPRLGNGVEVDQQEDPPREKQYECRVQTRVISPKYDARDRVRKPVEDGGVHGHHSDTDRDVLRQEERHYKQDPHLKDVYPKGGHLRQDLILFAYRRVEEIDEPAVRMFLVLVDHIHGQKRVEENQRQIVGG